MKCSFPVYQDDDLTHIAHQILAEDWVEDHDEELFQIAQAKVRNGLVYATVIGSNVTVETVNQDYTTYIKNRLDSL
jgi:hypothetical protein